MVMGTGVIEAATLLAAARVTSKETKGVESIIEEKRDEACGNRKREARE